MNKTLRSIASLFYFLTAFSFAFNASGQCSGNDAAFDNATITSVAQGSITYEYVIKNQGTQAMLSNKVTLQTFLSTDAAYDAGDQSAGSTDLSYTGVSAIPAGTTFTNSYTAAFSGALETYPYMILKLSYADGECDASNNQLVVCTRPNATISELYITNIGSSFVNYNFVIKNTGGDTLVVNKLILQNYFSANNTYDQNDAAGGGSFIHWATQVYIMPNETYSGSFDGNTSNLSSYSYLITQVSVQGLTECSTSDNQFVHPLTVTSLKKADSLADNIIWNTESKGFRVDDWYGKASGRLDYELYDASGTLVTSGKSEIGQVTPVHGMHTGIYVLVLHDDLLMASKKIMYLE